MNVLPTLRIQAVVILAMAALCPRARADVIYDNLSNGGNGFFGVAGNSWDAQRFNSDATNVVLTSATLSLAPGTAGQYRLSLFSDVANQPATALATLFSGSTVSVPPNGNVQFGGLSQPLMPNTNYWIVLSVDLGQSTTLGWEVTTTLTGTGTGFQLPSRNSTNQGGSWTDRGNPHKMLLTAVTVPEPTSATLVLLAVAGSFAAKRRVRAGGRTGANASRAEAVSAGGP